MTYSNIEWNSTTKDNVTISGGTVTSTNTTNNFDSKAESITTIYSGDIIKITGWANDRQLVGLGKDPYDAPGTTAEYEEVDYGVYFNSNTFEVYELGSNISTTQAGTTSDTIYIKNTGGTISYHLNSPTATAWYTSTVTAPTTLYAHATLKNQGSITIQYSTQTIEIGYDGTLTDPDQTIEIGYDDPDQTIEIGYDGTLTGAWKWWIGMRGKKRYGNKAIRRISI